MYTYEDLGWRTPFVIIAISLNVALSLATTGLGLVFDEGNPDLLIAALLLPAFLGSLATFLCAIVAVCVWTHRACANAFTLYDDWVAPSVTPGWAVGYYFVPFANLIKPYQAMREIDGASLGEPSTDATLGVWWGAWIVGNILANIGFRMGSPEADFGSAVVHLVSGVALVLVVRRMHEAQRQRHEALRRKGAPVVATFREPPAPAGPE